METVDGLFSRIEDWCERAKNDWQDDDLPFDAYLNVKRKWPVMATFDFDSLRTNIGSWGDINGALTNPNLLSLRLGPATGPRELHGLWFRVGQLQHRRRANLSELPQHLKRSQRKGAEGLGGEPSHDAARPGGYVVSGAIVTHLTQLGDGVEGAMGSIRIIPKQVIYDLWVRIRSVFTSYRHKWLPNHFEENVQAAPVNKVKNS